MSSISRVTSTTIVGIVIPTSLVIVGVVIVVSTGIVIVVVVVLVIIIPVVIGPILIIVRVSGTISLTLVITVIIIRLFMMLLLHEVTVIVLALVVLGWIGVSVSGNLLEHLLLLVLWSHIHRVLHAKKSLLGVLIEGWVPLKVDLRLLLQLHILVLLVSHESQVLFSDIHVDEIIEYSVRFDEITEYFHHFLPSLFPVYRCTILGSDNRVILGVLEIIKVFVGNILDKKPLNFEKTFPSSMLPPELK